MADDPAGNSPDAKMRELKHQLAKAETAGDTDAAEDLRNQLRQVRGESERRDAAASRQAAADTDASARIRAPQERTTKPEAKGQTTSTGKK